jgi:hypothetical protein
MKPLVLMLFTALAAQAAAVQLCTGKFTLIDNSALIRGQAIVTRAFAEADIRVEWLSERECKDAPGSIRVMLDAKAPQRFGLATMGYAMPYGSGAAVHIFYDRIREEHRSDFALILGYAMAHEIAHSIEGLARHGERGIMKANWTTDDYYVMRRGRLNFDSQDIELMQLGLRHAVQGSARQ